MSSVVGHTFNARGKVVTSGVQHTTPTPVLRLQVLETTVVKMDPAQAEEIRIHLKRFGDLSNLVDSRQH